MPSSASQRTRRPRVWLLRPLRRAHRGPGANRAPQVSNVARSLRASLRGAAPAGVAPFTIATKMDDAMGIIGAGIDVINNGDAVLHFAYDGQLGETTQIHAFVLKGSAKF